MPKVDCLAIAKSKARKELNEDDYDAIKKHFSDLGSLLPEKAAIEDKTRFLEQVRSKNIRSQFSISELGVNELIVDTAFKKALLKADPLGSVRESLEQSASFKAPITPIEVPLSFALKGVEREQLGKLKKGIANYDALSNLVKGTKNADDLIGMVWLNRDADIDDIVSLSFKGKGKAEAAIRIRAAAIQFIDGTKKIINDLRERLGKRMVFVDPNQALITPRFDITKIEGNREGFKALLKEHLQNEDDSFLEATIDRILNASRIELVSNPSDYKIDYSHGFILKHGDSAKSDAALIDLLTSKFTDGSILDQVVHTLRKMSTDVVLTETWGPTPYKNISDVANLVHEEVSKRSALSEKEVSDLNNIRATIDILVDDIAENYSEIGSPIIESMLKSLRYAFISAKLSGAVFYAAFDQINISQQFGRLDKNFLQGWFNSFSPIASIFTKIKGNAEERNEILVALGGMGEAFTGDVLKRNGVLNDLVENLGKMSKGRAAAQLIEKITKGIAGFTMRISGASGLNTSMKRGVIAGYSKFLFRYKGLSFEELKKTDNILYTRLVESGFDSEIWSKIADNNNFTNSLNMLDASKIKDDKARSALLGFLAREADLMITTPDRMGEYYSRLSATKKGLFGEFAKTGTQFFSYSLAFWRGAEARAVRESGGVLKWKNLGYLGALITIGMMVAYVKQMMTSDNPVYTNVLEWDKIGTDKVNWGPVMALLGKAFTMSAILPLAGDIIDPMTTWMAKREDDKVSAIPDYATDIIGTAAGPGVEFLGKAPGVVLSSSYLAVNKYLLDADVEGTDISDPIVDIMADLIPLGNQWLFKLFFEKNLTSFAKFWFESVKKVDAAEEKRDRKLKEEGFQEPFVIYNVRKLFSKTDE